MDDLAFLRERIESYADYTNDVQRHLSDEQVRAYLGVALAGVLENLHPPGSAAATLDALLLRCEFADQRVVRALETAPIGAAEVSAIHQADRDLVALADRSPEVDAPRLDAYLAEIDAAFERRTQILLGAADAARVPPETDGR